MNEIDTSTPEGTGLLEWMYPERACGRTDPHSLGECAKFAPRIAAVGDYVEIESRNRRESYRAVVLITSIDEREGYLYVGWANRQPGGGWDRRLGSWGFFRQYPAEREFGTSIVAVL